MFSCITIIITMSYYVTDWLSSLKEEQWQDLISDETQCCNYRIRDDVARSKLVKLISSLDSTNLSPENIIR